ncbi:hypothetical protein M413DRAFT_450122 [Hebeloma cylindrosporum]|uniref:Uncharacterized protein n=1 Tax=Hebeloma cylindrosporum TaxID=76867 RepID=A0A0C2Y0Q3_HEBCY|nr:hypothetical protein M413DRAFT_450122 [Hebeloma cylindrosporum h7]
MAVMSGGSKRNEQRRGRCFYRYLSSGRERRTLTRRTGVGAIDGYDDELLGSGTNLGEGAVSEQRAR